MKRRFATRTLATVHPAWKWTWGVTAVLLLLAAVAAIAQDVTGRGQMGTIGGKPFMATNPAVTPPSARTWSGGTGQPLYTNTYPDVELRRSRPADPAQPPLRSKPLKEGRPVQEALQSGHFLSTVGGVAFDQVAQPRPPLQVQSLKLRYDPLLPDGSRLVVMLNDAACHTLGLPDWQLVPIARYADSPYYALVTLFGELEGSAQRPPGQYVVAFHPSLESTLLGLRLFQADHMLLDPNITGELPRFGRHYRLGAGEVPPDPTVWRRAAAALSQIVSQGEFTSYVICDQVTPAFWIDKDRARKRWLKFDGQIFFHFWSRGPQQMERVLDPERGQVLYRSFQPLHRSQLSKAVSSQTRLLEQANPAVYRSTMNTMLFAAFFRYCKQHDLEMWKAFLDSLRHVPDDKLAAPTPVLIGR